MIPNIYDLPKYTPGVESRSKFLSSGSREGGLFSVRCVVFVFYVFNPFKQNIEIWPDIFHRKIFKVYLAIYFSTLNVKGLRYFQ